MMLSKILVAVDGSETSKRAFEYASFLAEKCNTSLLIVNIPDIFERVGSSSKKLEEIAKKIEKGEIGNKAMLKKFESQAKEYGIKDVYTIKQRGNVAEEILKIADKEKVDMIVLGSRGLSTAKVFLLGSVSHKVVQHAKCPVTVVR
ncbi:MAG TPA: universal stress protein [Nitrososphaeraceae archaeon]